MTPAVAAFITFAAAGLPAPQSAEEFARADQETRRLRPAEIPGLPDAVRRTLEDRGCTIPQAAGKKAPHNAVRGALTAPKAVEWAVLCSRSKSSSILVMSERSGTVVADFARRRDASFLQRAGPLGIIFSREISVADTDAVRALRSRTAERTSAAPNHDGIRDEFIDKYAFVWYRAGKKWVRLAGAD